MLWTINVLPVVDRSLNKVHLDEKIHLILTKFITDSKSESDQAKVDCHVFILQSFVQMQFCKCLQCQSFWNIYFSWNLRYSYEIGKDNLTNLFCYLHLLKNTEFIVNNCEMRN